MSDWFGLLIGYQVELRQYRSLVKMHDRAMAAYKAEKRKVDPQENPTGDLSVNFQTAREHLDIAKQCLSMAKVNIIRQKWIVNEASDRRWLILLLKLVRDYELLRAWLEGQRRPWPQHPE